MKTPHWLPLAVFLGVSIPLWLPLLLPMLLPPVLPLNALHLASEYRVWIALGAGALATAVLQSKLKSRGEQE